MISLATIVYLAGLVLTTSLPRPIAAINYTLTKIYDQHNFFEEFSFFSEPDPANGFVKYVNASTASREHLAGYMDGKIYLGVDHTNIPEDGGRVSVRVTSKESFTRGLFVGDIAHMPSGKTHADSCGLWPAYWTTGVNWPYDGEIDIIEGVNTQTNALMTLHTGSDFNVTNNRSAADTELQNVNCVGGVGCAQKTKMKGTYGADFNDAGGGIYVVEWADDVINAWFFGRHSQLPPSLSVAVSSISSSDYSSSSPSSSVAAPQIDVDTLGKPLVNFTPDSKESFSIFKDHKIIINTDFCGDWANKMWESDTACKRLDASCENYVKTNPQAFENAYWLINSILVFTADGDAISTTAEDTGSSGGGASNEAGRGGDRARFGRIGRARKEMRSMPFYA